MAAPAAPAEASSPLPVSWVIYVLVIWFGVSSWLSVNCLWVELPVIVEELPEKWKLPSYLTVIIQVANIGPVLITIVNKFFPERLNHKLLICFLLALGVVATFLLSFLWSHTVMISDNEHSLGLFILVFIVALVNCSSSVTFIPYMAAYRHEYVTAYFIGSGLSGLLPAALSLSQGIGGNNDCLNRTVINTTVIDGTAVNVSEWILEPVKEAPNFPASSFFIAMTVFMVLSSAAFVLLITWPFALRHQLMDDKNGQAKMEDAAAAESSERMACLRDNRDSRDLDENSRLSSPENDNNARADVNSVHSGSTSTGTSTITFIYILLLVCIVCGLSNTALYSVQTYSCLPYGNMAYHLSVVLSSVANPVGAFIPFWLSTESSLAFTALTSIAAAISSYIFLTAAMSPHPPLVGDDSGKALVILSWTLAIGLLSYIKTLLAGRLRTEGRRGLLWCGVFTQIGSAIGAFTLFPLVNIYNVFQASYNCNSITHVGLPQ